MPKTAEHIRRLEVLERELIEFHEWHRADQFDMEDFFVKYHDFQGHCKTACCVAGLAGLIPEFQALGLHTNKYGDVRYERYITETGALFGGTSGDNARVFFGLTPEESDTLFYEINQNQEGFSSRVRQHDSKLIPHTHLTKAAQVRAIINAETCESNSEACVTVPHSQDSKLFGGFSVATDPKPRTLAELAQEAIDIQDACNPLGLSKGYARSLQELYDRLRMDKLPNDTQAIRHHPINYLWTDKLADLAYNQRDFTSFGIAYDACKKLAEPR